MCHASENINQWIKCALQNTNFTNYKVEVERGTGRVDGFLSNITFAKVENLDDNSKPKYLHLVVKSSKESTILRNQFPLQACFEKEIYIYKTVAPVFEKLQKSCGVSHLLDFLPFVYTSQKTGLNELIILEDLSIRDFKLWNRLKPMNFDHMKSCLEAFAKWHAFSIALRRKDAKEFQKLITENNINIQSNTIIKLETLDLHCEMYETECMKAFGDKIKNFDNTLKFTKNEIKFALIDIFFEDLEDQVILHGDGWNNNFMFRTESNNKDKPIEIKVIDWQCSGVGSPVLDISLLIYCCANTKTHNNVKVFLEIYYDFLTQALLSLGVTANDVFSFNKLLQHWKKYSKYGLILGNFLLKFSHFDAEEAPDFDKIAENGAKFLDSLTELVRKNMVNEQLYIERVRNNLLHYIKNAVF